jgi:hypothetical protein
MDTDGLMPFVSIGVHGVVRDNKEMAWSYNVYSSNIFRWNFLAP